MSKRVGVVLSGCGYLDGSEIHEATLTLLALDRAGAAIECLAPNVELDEFDHLSEQPTGRKRNVLTESARIARGRVRDLRDAQAASLDILVLPGGYGAAKNLCTFASKGAEGTVHPEVARVVRAMRDANKPMGFFCIAPAVAALLFRGTGTQLKMTVGAAEGAGAVLGSLGVSHEPQSVEGVTVDAAHKVVSTPCYMFDARISEVARGSDRAVQLLLAM